VVDGERVAQVAARFAASSCAVEHPCPESAPGSAGGALVAGAASTADGGLPAAGGGADERGSQARY